MPEIVERAALDAGAQNIVVLVDLATRIRYITNTSRKCILGDNISSDVLVLEQRHISFHHIAVNECQPLLLRIIQLGFSISRFIVYRLVYS